MGKVRVPERGVRACGTVQSHTLHADRARVVRWALSHRNTCLQIDLLLEDLIGNFLECKG